MITKIKDKAKDMSDKYFSNCPAANNVQEELGRLESAKAKEAILLDEDGMMPDDDKINPTHYQSMDRDLESKGIDAITCMKAAFGTEAVIDFCICNAMKYLWRHESKGGKTDLLKCKWYIDKYIELKGYE